MVQEFRYFAKQLVSSNWYKVDLLMATQSGNKSKAHGILAWLDADNASQATLRTVPGKPRWEWDRLIPFLFIHLGCLAVFWAGWSPVAVGVAIVLYWVRMFAITAFYHRYFAHRTFQTSRLAQFFFGLWGLTAVQRGPLWWASHHRRHHRESDLPDDPHSPLQYGFWWSHLGWLTSTANLKTDYSLVQDLAKFPELVFLNRFDWLGAVLLALVLWFAGESLGPAWGTSGLQFLAWGFFISTTVLFHGTCTINSLSHQFGTRRYETSDTSRNNFWLALITLGEGWHNNHHFYANSVRQGFYWWEIDITFYILKFFSLLGLVHALNPVPVEAYELSARQGQS